MSGDQKCWFAAVKSGFRQYWMPIPTIQALIFRGLGVPLFYGTWKDALYHEAKSC